MQGRYEVEVFVDGKIYSLNEKAEEEEGKLWRRREIKIEGGKYKNCGGGGKARLRRENKKNCGGRGK